MTSLATSKINVLRQACRWQEDGHQVALATVIETWNSAPCPVGSLLAVRDDMLLAGSVSGGCVESDVVAHALEIMASGHPEITHYGVADETAWKAGLPCGGEIKIHIAPLHRLQSQDIKQQTVLATSLSSGEQCFIEAKHPLAHEAQRALQQDTARIAEHDGEQIFLNPFLRSLHLVIVGAGHIAQTLVPMALSLGYEVTLVEPREVFARPERFPPLGEAFHIAQVWPDERELYNKHTAVVSLSHDPKIDDVALKEALRHECFYIGALGSRRSHRARCERLRATGIPESALVRIHGPVGLDIRAQTPAEIALSILAQITQIRHAPPIAAVILAAGQSQRSKEHNKLLLSHEGKPLIRHVVEAAVASRAAPIIVVTGHEADAVEKTLCDLKPLFIHNANYKEGMGTSLACGIAAVPGSCAGALVCLGDMPYVRAAHLNHLIESFNEKEHRVCIPVVQGQQGNPVLWSSSFFTALGRLRGDTGAKPLLPADAHKVLFQDTALLRDVDRPG